jgi:hypothetical protein
MVAHTRTKARTDQLRSLNQPQPIQVRTTKRGRPAEIRTQRGRQSVREIQDIWRIDDEWWREPVRRFYYRVLLANGHLCTVYEDQVEEKWFMQGY